MEVFTEALYMKKKKGFSGIFAMPCRLVKAPPFFLSKHSCPILKPLGATLTPAHLCLFLKILGDKQKKKSKDHMQTGNDRLALGLLQRE